VDLHNQFTVEVPVDEAWQLLLDFERVAAAMPGATITRVDGDRIEGTMVVKLGPMRIQYEGVATITSRDQEQGRLVIEASGKESRGTGTARVTINTSLEPDPSGTTVSLQSVLEVTGRPAQMGIGLIQDVAQNLTDEFVKRLSDDLRTSSRSEGPTDLRAPDQDDDAWDLGVAAAAPLFKRLAVLAVVAAIGLLVVRIRRWVAGR
jgi:uncharacterized protein